MSEELEEGDKETRGQGDKGTRRQGEQGEWVENLCAIEPDTL